MKKNTKLKKTIFPYYVVLSFLTVNLYPFVISTETQNEKLLLFIHTILPILSFFILFYLFKSKNQLNTIISMIIMLTLLSTVLVLSSIYVLLLSSYFWYT